MKQSTTQCAVQQKSRLSHVAVAVAALLCLGGVANAADSNNGRQLYMQHCQNCHGADGKGQLPGTPNFARGEGLLKPDLELVRTIRAGRGMMPSFEGMLKEEELLDVVAFLRTLR
ncbi:MAG: cytochrome c [Chromatiales bacterium]|jgi:mono/diheme cytochrome c family protein|nr:cytochrome c [Chromatiales bacterium]